MAGFDTASTVQSQVPAAINVWGAPAFWVRYFPPCGFTPLSSDPVTECTAIWNGNSGSPHLGTICAPAQSRLSGSGAEGQADAQSFISALISTYTSVGPLQLPTNGTLFCWVDQEASTSLSLSYWNGYANYVNGYAYAGGHPFHAALYCNPFAAPPNCSVIDNASAAKCYAVWSSEPLECGNTLSNTPAWAAESCSGKTTYLWQYWDEGICYNTNANVDLDVGHPNTSYGDYCFYLSAKP
ncbi:MAG TPA: hypothetical protein VGS97_04950 [Actinocrinis sp.]|uniref:hypothetical protein n=1 Tax=Actinocrinis sp. TaxID=1920516 RepID=UPI002DDD483A|nr:hypothetical protein [Actinocrinis sp.]HEV2343420.1 hypothetical protein [Actinocrinis sp.]